MQIIFTLLQILLLLLVAAGMFIALFNTTTRAIAREDSKENPGLRPNLRSDLSSDLRSDLSSDLPLASPYSSSYSSSYSSPYSSPNKDPYRCVEGLFIGKTDIQIQKLPVLQTALLKKELNNLVVVGNSGGTHFVFMAASSKIPVWYFSTHTLFQRKLWLATGKQIRLNEIQTLPSRISMLLIQEWDMFTRTITYIVAQSVVERIVVLNLNRAQCPPFEDFMKNQDIFEKYRCSETECVLKDGH